MTSDRSIESIVLCFLASIMLFLLFGPSLAEYLDPYGAAVQWFILWLLMLIPKTVSFIIVTVMDAYQDGFFIMQNVKGASTINVDRFPIFDVQNPKNSLLYFLSLFFRLVAFLLVLIALYMVLKLYIRLTNVIKMLEDVRRAATVQKSDHRKEIARFEAEKEGKNQTYNRNMEKSKTDHEQQMEELGMSKDRKLTELSAVRGTLLEELKMIYIQHKEEREVLIAEVEKTTLAYRRGVKETEREFAPLLLQQANLVSEIQAKFDVLVEKVAKLEEKGVESGLVAAAPRPPAEPIPEAGCQIKAPISRLLNLAQEAPSWPLPVAVELPEAEPEVVNEITSWRRIDPELETGFAPGAPEILPVAPLAIVPGTLVSAPPLPHGPKIIVEATSEQQPDSIPFGMARIPGLYEVLVHDTSASVAGVRQEQTNGDDGVGKGKFEDEKVEEKTEFEDEDEDDWEDVYD